MNHERYQIGDEIKFGRYKGRVIGFTEEKDEGDGLFRLPFYKVEVVERWGTDIYEVPLVREVKDVSKGTDTGREQGSGR